MRLLIALLLGALLSGCAIAPKTAIGVGPNCGFKRFVLATPTPHSGVDERAGDPRVAALDEPVTLADAIARALRPGVRALNGRRFDPSMLFLSGGSQHGAFGAGYLAAWQQAGPDHRLPNFSVVTGISTGSIQATFAFIDEPDTVANAYAIRNENELLTRLVGWSHGAPTTTGYVGLVRKGAIADLAPLRAYLRRVITDDVLAKVAAGVSDRRLLLVGVVDVDTGGAVALDMTDMAQQWADPRNEGRKALLHACYVEAIVASSSAPMAALPVFIDDRMYVDGGARFGAFTDRIGEVMDRPEFAQAAADQPVFYLLVNGNQTTASKCGRADIALCVPPGRSPPDPPQADAGAHAKWKFLDLALRSEGILSNQVYRLSIDSIAAQARERHYKLYYAQIDDDVAAFPFHLDDPVLGHGDMTCSQAEDTDRALLDPVQFYPRYMHCLIAYGRARLANDIRGGTWK